MVPNVSLRPSRTPCANSARNIFYYLLSLVGIRVNIYSQVVVFVLLIYGLFFDFFKTDGRESCFIVTGIEGLIDPIFLTRLNTVEVGVDALSIGGRATL